MVCEDGHEYTERFERMLGAHFHFVRAGHFAEARSALAQPVAGLLLDLDFRRTPAAHLVDEAGQEHAGAGRRGAPAPGRRAGIARAAGAAVSRRERPRRCCSPIWTTPGQVEHLQATLAPMRVLSSRIGLDVVARLLGELAAAAKANG